MTLFGWVATALAAATVATAAYTPVPRSFCNVLEGANLVNIDVLGCGRVLTHGKRAPGAASKEQVCAAMQAAGLSNLGFFGCEVQTFQEHKREMQTMEERMGFHPPKQPPTVPSKPPCDDDKPPKGPPVHPPPPPSTEPPHSDDSPKPTCSTQELCKVIQSGLINIDVLGCSKVGVHLKRNVEEDEGGMGEVKIAECKRGTDGLCKHWPSGPHRSHGGHGEGQGSGGGGGGTGWLGGSQGKQDPPECKKEACTILQHAGLINIGVLGCSQIGAGL